LTTDAKAYVLPEECDCKSELGCSKCRASLTLEVESQDETVVVYSSDLKPQDPNVKPVSDKIPIVKLAPRQKIRLEAYAKLGRGIEHAKWQPVSACAYKYLPHVTIDSKRATEAVECAKWCPKNVFTIEGNRAVVKNEMNCTLCMECVKHCEKKPPIKVEGDDTSFVFYVEPTGSIPIRTLVSETSRILAGKADELHSKLS
jgi:DNA-directed RNA polymerase subunit D